MIVIAKRSVRRCSIRSSQRQFLEMLPKIRRYAHLAFRGLNPELRDELVAEVVANAFVAFRRLIEQGKAELAYPTPLAQYAIRQVRVGRKVGGTLNVHDVTSFYCQSRKGIPMERLDRFDREEMAWCELIVEDRHAGPAETAASRIDFAAWLRSLSRRKRKLAVALGMGETTTAAARKLNVSLGRVSQLRRELQEAWEAFVGEPAVPSVA